MRFVSHADFRLRRNSTQPVCSVNGWEGRWGDSSVSDFYLVSFLHGGVGVETCAAEVVPSSLKPTGSQRCLCPNGC